MTYAKDLLHYLIKASRRPNSRVLRRKERKLQRQLQALFELQKAIIIAIATRLLNKKALDDDVERELEEALKESDEDMIDIILEAAADAMEFGGEFRIRKDKLDQIGIAFDLTNPLAIEYLQSDRPLILAKISETTKELVKNIILESARLGRSPQETAKLLDESFAFSRSRSLMIATNEIGNAYEEGNLIPMQDAAGEGENVEKRWQTVNDDRVTPTHTQNQNDGWIDIDETFSGTGDLRAPGSDNPRCRCTTLYRINS